MMDSENYLYLLIELDQPISENARKAYKWIEEQGFSFDIDEQRELGKLIFLYLKNKMLKEKERETILKTSETYNERLRKKAIPYAKKLISLLMEGNMSQKGIDLGIKLIDLQLHPEEYLYKPKKIYANLDDIKYFFSSHSINADAKKELFSILKN